LSIRYNYPKSKRSLQPMSKAEKKIPLLQPSLLNDPEFDQSDIEPTPSRKVRRLYARNDLLQPFLKWAGGKRQLLPKLREQMPAKFKKYFEPFIGAGALLLDQQPKRAYISDANAELINVYRVIRDHADELLEDIHKHKNTSTYFYKLRELDRLPEYKKLSAVERASRIIFLNKTCYNGLFRVNKQGHFNAPFGDYHKPLIVDNIVIRAVSKYLQNKDIQIEVEDFSIACARAKAGDFVYLDPPYDPISDTSSFTGYNFGKFDRDEQRRLKAVVADLTRRKCLVLVSNSATNFIKELYADYTIIQVEANRNINSVGTGRGKIQEVLIRNY
jgi:DNA adenine methylase